VVTFIVGPELVDFIEVLIVKVLVEGCWMLVIESSKALELIVDPISLIGFEVRLVEEDAIAFHLIFTPFAVIAASILIVELSFAMSHSVKFESFISTSHLEVLFNEGGLQFKLAIIAKFRGSGEFGIKRVS
jgi:hypothetical protein